MRVHRKIVLVAAGLLIVASGHASGQTSDVAREFWPKVQVTFDPAPRLGVMVFAEKQHEDISEKEWKVGATLSYRIRRILKTHRADVDEDNHHSLVVGAGYEYVRTDKTNGTTKRENRVLVQATPRYTPGAGLLLQDRNRAEFRWVGGTYDFRYRNKLTVDRPFKISKVRLTPYAAGELFWDRNHHSWNENQYTFGVQIPYKKLLMVDTYYLRQNCTTCSPDPISVFGITLNVYFRRKK